MDNEMNGYIEFFYQFSDRHPAVSVRMSPDAAIPEVLEAFEGFLRAAGYHFTGQLDITQEEPQYPQDSELN